MANTFRLQDADDLTTTIWPPTLIGYHLRNDRLAGRTATTHIDLDWCAWPCWSFLKARSRAWQSIWCPWLVPRRLHRQPAVPCGPNDAIGQSTFFRRLGMGSFPTPLTDRIEIRRRASA